MDIQFRKLEIKGWRQFYDVDIKFHEKLTVITGANGAGKSTILRILAQHFGWAQPILATPIVSKEGVLRYLSGWFDRLKKREATFQPVESQISVGALQYSNDAKTELILPQNDAITYNLAMPNRQAVPGLFISSHRPVSSYQPVVSVPINAISAEQAYQTYYQEMMQRSQNAFTQYGPVYRMKEAIISMAMFGVGNENVPRNNSVSKLYDDFKIVLSKILPPTIGFESISIRVPDVVLVTKTGDFVLDASSGGLMSLLDLAWQIFLFSQGKTNFTVAIDEPENHLHPSMQRTLFANLTDAFPQAQFIVATHSPFVVSSVKDSNVYVLRYDSKDGELRPPGLDRRISSTKLDLDEKAATANEILRDVLGVPVTLPEWAERELRNIASDFKINEFGKAEIEQLRARLEESGLGEFFPEALAKVAGPR